MLYKNCVFILISLVRILILESFKKNLVLEKIFGKNSFVKASFGKKLIL